VGISAQTWALRLKPLKLMSFTSFSSMQFFATTKSLTIVVSPSFTARVTSSSVGDFFGFEAYIFDLFTEVAAS
jgi:hypothetical protein